MRQDPSEIQRSFYESTAGVYDEMHVRPSDEHACGLELISTMIRGSGWTSVLDVGAGTGRGVEHFLENDPELTVRGIEPVPAMIREAEGKGVPAGLIEEGEGQRLPFEDDEFDVVIELGVLHHVENPAAVVDEMARVAKHAVFLSDENRFGNGTKPRRLVKFALHRMGLWDAIYRLATKGRGYHLTTGDGGVAYSYSVYDSLPQLGDWADRVFLVPTEPAEVGWFHPLFGAHHILLAAIRD